MEFRITLRGTEALLMHNVRLANPMDSFAKRMKDVTSKRSKTDEDHAELARLEFLGGLYHHAEVGPYIPGENIERCLVDAGKVTKSGTKVTRGVFITSNINPLSYSGGTGRSAEELWEDENHRHYASVRVMANRVMRCRPMFNNWAVEAVGTLDPSIINLSELQSIARTAGSMIGIGDYRPRFGRFEATIEEIKK